MEAYWLFLADRDSTYRFGFELGQALLATKNSPKLLAALGNLGAGKTSLAQGLARGIGVAESVYVNSPTFAIHQSHLAHKPSGQLMYFHHLDLYRLGDEDDLVHLGLEELIETGISYVEWPQRAPFFFQAHPHLQVQLFHLDEWEHSDLSENEDGRVLCIKGSSAALTELVEKLSPSLDLKQLM